MFVGDTFNSSYSVKNQINEVVYVGSIDSNLVDTSTIGTYPVTYSYTDSYGDTITLNRVYEVSDRPVEDYGPVALEPSSVDLNVYYSGITNQTGETLKSALYTVVRTGFSGKNYDAAKYILNITDADIDNPGNVILMYTGWSKSGTWDGGSTWNREHVWPQSLLGQSAGGSVNSASDLHNLKPTDQAYNSSRGNSPFSDSLLIKGSPVREEVRGDIARILFYMVVMYPELELVDTAPNVYEMAYLSTLLEWHANDPVDAFEMRRNNLIHEYQGNRNPFIDRPYYVERLFSVTLSNNETVYVQVYTVVYDPYLNKKQFYN